MTDEFISIQNIIEAALFSSQEPLSMDQLLRLFDENSENFPHPDTLAVQEAIAQLRQCYVNRSIELKETASGFQFQVKNSFAPWIQRLWTDKLQPYSRALLETLAIIAYRQPITRGEIENIRGVSVGTYMIQNLIEHGWVRRAGHRDLPGRPTLYVTTKQFLDHFGLKNLDELPTLTALDEKIKPTPKTETLSLFPPDPSD